MRSFTRRLLVGLGPICAAAAVGSFAVAAESNRQDRRTATAPRSGVVFHEDPPSDAPAPAKAGASQPDPTTAGMLAAAAQQGKEQRARWDGASARRERQASRREFRALGHGDVIEAIRRTHPRFLHARRSPLSGGTLPPAVEYLSPDRALVTRGKETTLLASNIPFTVQSASGADVPVDLSLVERGESGLAPKASPTSLHVGARAADGVMLTDSRTGLRPRDVGPADGSYLAGPTVIWTNVGVDRDYAVVAVPWGAETFDILRSPDASARLRYEILAPPGADVRPVTGDPADALLAEIRVQGERVAGVSTPRAWDADGRAVPVATQLAGAELIMDVDHTAGDFRYPIVVDPLINEWFQNWRTDPAVDFGRTVWHPHGGYPSGGMWWGAWEFSSTRGAPWFASYAGDGQFGGRGLYLYGEWGANGPQTYNQFDQGEWRFRMPRGAFIKNLHFAWMRHYSETGVICRRTGVRGPTGTWDGGWFEEPGWGTGASPRGVCGLWYGPAGYPSGYGHEIHHIDNPSLGGMAVFESVAQATASDNWMDFTGGAIVEMGDTRPPSVTGSVRTGRWVGAAEPLSARATDDGLGINLFALSAPSAPAWSGARSWSSGCGGDRGSRCAFDLEHLSSVGNLPEGNAIRIEAAARDVVTNQSQPTLGVSAWDLKVDRSDPGLSSTGPLDNPDRWVPRDANLSVTATDSYSGVSRIDFDISGQPRDFTTPASACDAVTQCPTTLSDSYRLPDGTGQGPLTWKVTAKDPLGHDVDDGPWGVIVDDEAPSVTALTHSGKPNGWVKRAQGSVTLAATDAGSGVTRYQLALGSERTLTRDFGCAGTYSNRCPTAPGSHTFAYDSDASGEQWQDGVHTLRLTARDGPAYETVADSWEVRVDRTPPLISLDGTLAEAEGAIVSGESYQLAVEATDEGPDGAQTSGVANVTIQVDERSPETFPTAGCSTDGCPTNGAGNLMFSTEAYGDGEHEITITTTDAAGNSDSE